MPTVRPHRLSRSGLTAGSRWSLRARIGRTGGAADDGFTMVEMLVALVIIGIVMTALASFFVSTVSATARQGTSQAAIQLADDAIERVRAMKETAIVNGRDLASSTTQWNTPVTGVAPYLTDMTMVSDSGAAAGAGATATLPTSGSPVLVNGLTYYQNWYIGQCWQLLGGGSCGKVGPTGTLPSNTYASFYRVVVAVTWNDTVCTSGHCVFLATTLVSNAGWDPQFDSNLVAQPPKVVNPGNQTSDMGVADPLQLTATGGAGAITWNMSGLPTGMTFTTSGGIAGAPTALGTFNVALSATDSFGLIGTAAFVWTIVAPPVVTATAQTDEVGTAASYTATCTCPGAVTWTSTALPPGLSLNATTGLMSGTPTTANTTGTSVTVTATDAQGVPSAATFNWIIAAQLQVTTVPDQSNALGTAITNLQLTATGGIGGHTWSVTGLPAGLNLNTSTGVISGTPTAGSASGFSVTVKATDTAGVTDTDNFNWVVSFTGLSIATPANQVSYVGTADSLTVTKSGGFGTYTWSANNLPTGLNISTSTGQITGTPSVAGQFSVTVSVRDSEPLTVTTSTFIWTVVVAPNIVTPTNTIGSAKGTAVSVTPIVAGGVGPYTWSAGTTANPSSTLPAGVSINTTTGVMSGTPTATSTTNYSVTLKVTDANGVTDTQAFTWSVVVTTTTTTATIQPISNQFGTVGTAFAGVTPTSVGGPSGGATTTTWSQTGMPSTWTFSTTTGAITATAAKVTTAATYTITVTVTVKKNSTTATDSQVYTITVYAAAPNITTPTTTTQTNVHGVAITPEGAVATGGSGYFTWSVNTLPQGLSINAYTGVISGTPTTVNSTGTSVTVTVTDQVTGKTDTQQFTWKIT